MAPTTNPEFVSQTLLIENLPIKLEVWDTAGSENYKSITNNFYRNAAGVFLVFDITRRESFTNIVRWYEDAKTNSNHENMTYVLIGNKTDLAGQ